ncbi:hypothetical protein AAIR98_001921 [Elusimicrobium simillimum]|uniref:HEAT repeat domain-containing protein n=1 Tax=Elusimicrobium simillimum TaxID=3143438 RepID=UPI003C6FD36A
MKKFLLVLTMVLYVSFSFSLENTLPAAVQNRNLVTEQDFFEAVQSFAKTTDSSEVFMLAVALIDSPPPLKYENTLFNVIISNTAQDMKKFFASVILSSMNGKNVELIPMTKDVFASTGDAVIKGYAAASLAILAPKEKTNVDSIVALYPHDKIFALKAVNALYSDENKIIAALKKASKNSSPLVRRGAAQMLGTFAGEKSNKILLSMLKSERDSAVVSDAAFSAGRTPVLTLKEMNKCIKTDFTKPYAFACALTIGFMTGDGFSLVKDGINSDNENVQINALRAASVMANTLAGDNASVFSRDIAFDKQNLKTLIPAVAALSGSGKTDNIKKYAEQTVKDFRKML